MLDGVGEGPHQGLDARQGRGARAEAVLLPAAVAQGAELRGGAAAVQADPRGPVELVGAEGEEVHGEGGQVQGHVAGGLHRVRVHAEAVRGELAADGGEEAGQVLDGADLVVHEHEGEEAGLAGGPPRRGGAAQQAEQVVGVHDARAVDGGVAHVDAALGGEELARVVDGGVLREGGDDEAPGAALQHEVVPLRAPAREADGGARGRVQEAEGLGAGGREGARRGAAVRVLARRVRPVGSAGRREEGGEGRGGVVQVDGGGH